MINLFINRIFRAIKIDIETHAEGYKGGFLSGIGHILLHPSIRMLFSYRLQRLLGSKPNAITKLLRRMLWMGNCRKSGCHISPLAEIEPGVRFPHPVGIIIGHNVKIGKGSAIFQNVTLGAKRSEEGGDSPVVGENTNLYASSIVIGKLNIGSNVIIGANSLVMFDVPDGKTAAGNPAKIIEK